MSYRDAKRRTGSQKEIPKLIKYGNIWRIKGYQAYQYIHSRGPLLKRNMHYYQKFLALSKLFKILKVHSLADLGCSNGLVSFLAAHNGINRVLAYDHDTECVALINQLALESKQSHIVTGRQYSFGDKIPKVDTVIAGALIHWVYSCTAKFGSLNIIIKYLADLCTQMLVVEWISPKDPAIKAFKHLSFNQNIHQQPYTHVNFLKALHKHFSFVAVITRSSATRIMYIGIKNQYLPQIRKNYRAIISPKQRLLTTEQIPEIQNNPLPENKSRTTPKVNILYLPRLFPKQRFRRFAHGYCGVSFINSSQTIVIKHVQKYLNYSVLEREVYWLKRLKVPWAPKLIKVKKPYIAMSYCGRPVTRYTLPINWREQLKIIRKDMLRYNCQHNDLKGKELLVYKGQLYLIDFGWASLNNDMSCGKLNIDQRRKPHKNFNDWSKLLQTI